MSTPAYRALPQEDQYETLVGPGDFECELGEPEDRTLFRDLKPLVDRLNEQHEQIVAMRQPRPEVVCVVGSTRFVDEHAVQRWEMEKKGIITLGINLLPASRGFGPDHQADAEGPAVKEMLDAISLSKVALADRVFVVNCGGYIGDSTRAEIEYANKLGKPVSYLEPVSPTCASPLNGDDHGDSQAPARADAPQPQ